MLSISSTYPAPSQFQAHVAVLGSLGQFFYNRSGYPHGGLENLWLKSDDMYTQTPGAAINFWW